MAKPCCSLWVGASEWSGFCLILVQDKSEFSSYIGENVNKIVNGIKRLV